ncbi:MAG: hypothetical protein AB4041_06830 [Microcystaceae cyanobacterium]
MTIPTESIINQTKPLIPSRDQRRYIRYLNNQGRAVKLLLKSSPDSLLIESEGIVLDESFGGVGLLILTTEEVYTHQVCYVEVPEMGWIQAQIIWVTMLSDELYKRVGVRYLS